MRCYLATFVSYSPPVVFAFMFLPFICRAIFIDPATNRTWKEGDLYKRENLAKTLEKVAQNGPEEFYNGTTAQNLIKDIEAMNSIMTLADLKNYRYILHARVLLNMISYHLDIITFIS